MISDIDIYQWATQESTAPMITLPGSILWYGCDRTEGGVAHDPLPAQVPRRRTMGICLVIDSKHIVGRHASYIFARSSLIDMLCMMVAKILNNMHQPAE